MNEFNYILLKDSFTKATTIKERKRIFDSVLALETTPYSYTLGSELIKLMRPQDIRQKHRDHLDNQRSALRNSLRKALLTAEEAALVFGTTYVSLDSIYAVDAVKLCNTVPNLNCRGRVAVTSASDILSHIRYSLRGTVELILLRDQIPGYKTNKLYQQLTADAPSYEELTTPLLAMLESLKVLKLDELSK